ncbi:MAG: transglycosylase domain-containing protein [Acidobacteriaceae bacterium]
MPVKVKLGSPATRSGFGATLLRLAIVAVLAVMAVGGIVFGYYYFKYEKIVDDRLAAGPMFANTAQIYATPSEVRVGQKFSATAIAAQLREAGYSNSSQLGAYQLRSDSPSGAGAPGRTETIKIKPGPQSYHSPDGATIVTRGGVVQDITGENGVELQSYELEPLLITGLSEDKSRTKRRLITYNEIPAHLVQAVLAIEDRRFFEHGGVNYYRLAASAFTDITTGRKAQGGSTLTMQLARGFFLTPEKRYTRKIIEIMITFQLEARFNKQQIFQMYANEINLGQRGSFAINGFGEAAQAYFGKDIRQLNLQESALIAGMIQRPNYFSPYKHYDRAMERRNLVLDSMVETGAITQSQADAAKAEPIKLAAPNVDASEAPYFVDLVHEQLMQKFGDQDLNRQGLRIYTSLDPQLQRAAADAVDDMMQEVDEQVRKLHTHRVKVDGKWVSELAPNITYPQVALVALDPHTGQVLALVGGRNYGTSQLDHAVARRPTGSIFKPFVYAAAYNTSITGATLPGLTGPFTAVTQLNDEPTTFTFDNGRQTYNPGNYKSEFHGNVTAIYALAHSLNNATISLGQMVGFENVAQLGRESGIRAARGTPSVAIGTYDATPLDMAGAYTVFANNGVHIDPWLLASVRNTNGDVLADYAPNARQVLDQRAAFLTTSLMEGVMNFGYGYEVRKRGFMAPAAGKTGTSHDAWFAGYTSNLICIVWVGNDDYTDVKLAGALAAAPIWADFMKRAVLLPQYSDTHEFLPPDGVVEVKLDKATNLLADSTCPSDYTAAFLDGTQPYETCSNATTSGSDQRNLLQKIFGLGKPPAVNTVDPAQPNVPAVPPMNAAGASPAPTQATPKKRGFFGKLFGKGDKQPNATPQGQPAPQNPPQ